MIQGLACDLDETLSATNSFWFREMQHLFGNPEGFSVDEMAAKYKFAQRVPYWQTPEAFAWMDERRSDNGLQKKFEPIDGCQSIVQMVHGVMPISCYLTIRPESVVGGTKEWLEMHSFPKAPIVARPENISLPEASLWKARTLEQNQDSLLGLIDDNPAVLSHLTCYRGTIFLYAQKEAPKSMFKTVACPDWTAVYESVKAFASGLVFKC